MKRRKGSSRKPFQIRSRPSLDELPLWALSQGASCWIIDLAPYEACRIAGVVESLVLDPPHGSLEAVVTDGTASVVARWHIRRPTRELAVAPGRFVLIEGLPMAGDDGLVMLEPDFEVCASGLVA